MLYAALLGLIGLIFHSWFTFSPISSGDLSYFFNEQIVQYFNLPFMWEAFRNIGFGGDSFIHQGVYIYNLPFGLLGKYFDFGTIERIIWFYPILLLGILSPLAFARNMKLFSPRFYPLTIIIYFLNTYFLMIMGGGQITVVFGYLIIPLLFAAFQRIEHNQKFSRILQFALFFSLLILFDFRYAYIFLIIVFLSITFSLFFLSKVTDLLMIFRRYVVIFFFSLIVVIGTQAYWLLPYLTSFHSPTAGIGNAYTSSDAVTYFSFAKFEQTISLLHPYWPENIFGKVTFMQPEFLLLPILAFSSLFFLSKKRKSHNQAVMFFAILGLIGAFLAKGTNPPFGQLYLWMFGHIPGFIMFRDPTKWYTLVALSYSVLIPFAIEKIFNWIKSKSKFRQIYTHNVFLLLCIFYLVFLIRPAVINQLGGTFQPVTVPKGYITYKNFIHDDTHFSRVLWIPTMQRFTFYSDTHPAISGNDFFNTSDPFGVVMALEKNNAKTLLEQSGVKYVVVPDDTQKEIFLTHRTYDEKLRTETIRRLGKISWLKKVKSFDKITIFEIPNPKDHFYSLDQHMQLSYKEINPTLYFLTVSNAKKVDKIIFVESYAGKWQATGEKQVINSVLYGKLFNSFTLTKDGTYTLKIAYKPQDFVIFGLVVSGITFLVVIMLLIIL